MASTSNKTIAYNTMLLYVRMVITMGVSFFTVRIVLQALGAEDYGINNAVGGFISVLSFLSNSLAGASQRFLSFQLGKDKRNGIQKFFNLSIWAYIVLSIAILILCETIGLWFLHNKMNIPVERTLAADWVYQSAVACFIISINTAPYIAAIFSHEKMNVYAYVSIVEALMKLVIAYALLVSSYDKLIVYAVFLVVSQLLVSLSYCIYARVYIKGCRFIGYWNKTEMKEILSYSGWTLFGSFSGAMKSQGVNVLLNMFFNPTINAARGIAFSLQALVNGLRVNFYNAVSPQIVKRYAAGDIDSMHNLLFMSSKMAFYLVLYLAIPVLLIPDVILGLWLGDYPEYSVIFTKLVVIDLLIDMYTNPLTNSINASGKVKGYQFYYSFVTLLIVPITYVILNYIKQPEVAFYTTIFITICSYMPTFYFARKTTGVDVMRFLKEVMAPCLIVFIVSFSIASLLSLMFTLTGLSMILVTFIISAIILTLVIYILGLNNLEKNQLNAFVIKIVKR